MLSGSRGDISLLTQCHVTMSFKFRSLVRDFASLYLEILKIMLFVGIDTLFCAKAHAYSIRRHFVQYYVDKCGTIIYVTRLSVNDI